MKKEPDKYRYSTVNNMRYAYAGAAMEGLMVLGMHISQTTASRHHALRVSGFLICSSRSGRSRNDYGKSCT